jgi:threonine synthase
VDDIDHVLTRSIDPSAVVWPTGTEANPFVRYRTLLHSYHLGLAHGMRDAEYVELVERLDKEVAAVDGHGFTVTPLARNEALSERLGFAPAGGVWVKDETGNVSGSHKARHLMGLLIHLEVVARLGLRPEGDQPDLAIASCGNAALAAAVVANAGGRQLQVFVPTWGDPNVIARLEELGAMVTVVPREAGVPGDPTYLALKRAIDDGALPFTCQGNENGLVIEGGQTLGYELASQLTESGTTLDALFIQVGGGALASAVIQGLREAGKLRAIHGMPRIHTVQTAGAHPLERAYHRLVEVQAGLAYARTHRSEFMWPWEDVPKSVAHGILDDETYDWAAVLAGFVETGGGPIRVDEEILLTANDLAREATGIDVDPTGSAGLAGIMESRQGGGVGSRERLAVLFTGVRRRGGAA